MRKSLWIIGVLLLLVAIGAPNACAESFTYSLTFVDDGAFSFSWTTSSMPGVTSDTSIAVGALASSTVSPTGTLGGSTLESVDLDPLSTSTLVCAAGDCIVSVFSNPSGSTDIIFPVLPAGALTTPGTYTFLAHPSPLSQETLVVRATAATPEPSTFGFMLIGFGLLGLVTLRRRISLGHPQAI